MTPQDLEAILNGTHGDPFSVLGPHQITEVDSKPGVDSKVDGWEVRAFLPQAMDAVAIVGGMAHPMRKTRSEGFFEAQLPVDPADYKLHLTLWNGSTEVIEDPYRFPPLISDFDLHIHGEGTQYESYRTMGAHLVECLGVHGVRFVVWAPNAEVVSVVGDFNDWDDRRHPMRRRTGGIWEIFLPGVGPGANYKYCVRAPSRGFRQQKADPYGFAMEVPPQSASIVSDLAAYQWNDQQWMDARGHKDHLNEPISIYEVHLGSWLRGPNNSYLSYRELADKFVEYAVRMGSTPLELLPIMEHPFSGSWGYQIVGFYAPTSRFGSPQDFMYFVDRCHQAGLGVIVDWVPGHFPKDAHGLARFDGTALYEHADPRQGEHHEWGTLVFNYGRHEVRAFLLSSALFWLEEYHADGLRVDAVASMLYRDYSREGGDWIPNVFGGRENLEAISFLREFNEDVYRLHPDVQTYAEESTAWPMVSRPTYLGGLGFGFKWDMGWMHDTLDYFEKDPIFRRYHQGELTFGLIYAWHENFVLPISHDEVVHGKRSLLDKMPGDRWQKFANLRSLYAFMWAHPGKKLLFMGGELAEWEEWSHDGSLP